MDGDMHGCMNGCIGNRYNYRMDIKINMTYNIFFPDREMGLVTSMPDVNLILLMIDYFVISIYEITIEI